jgi:long-chain acyl-CoA synthetase
VHQHGSQTASGAATTVPQAAELKLPSVPHRQPYDTARVSETLQALVHALADHGEKPAVVAFQQNECQAWSFTMLADYAQRLAAGLAEAGLQRGDHVLLFAPNRPEWILACCALLAAGAVPVPVDAQSSEADLRHVLVDSDARWMCTTTVLARHAEPIRDTRDVTALVLDGDMQDQRHWRHYVAHRARELPTVAPKNTAVLFYTSGTTGRPKGVPLTHRNLTANLWALLDQGLIPDEAHLLLPLPLHDVYPFTVGLLAPVAAGVPIILPFSLTGRQLLRALREGQATAIVGVPRFYEALYAAIETRVGQRDRLVSTLFHGAPALSTTLRRWWGIRLGRRLFTSLHKEFGPRLRVVASGGAALDPALAWKLEGLGWQVATGYGLTETSPILTFNSPSAGRLDTAGKPLPGVELRIAPPAPQAEHGEVLVKGPNVFASYRHLPDKTAEGFTDDGYFRTDDLGYIDNAGYLHLVGRASSMIVLPGGENVQPEKVEDALTHSEDIREAGVLERNGRLVALVVPETRAQDVDQALEQRIRDAIAQQSQQLPSHHQISDYALTFDPLPRTRLGKLRRHSLAERYAQAKLGGAQPRQERGPLPLKQMAPEDR